MKFLKIFQLPFHLSFYILAVFLVSFLSFLSFARAQSAIDPLSSSTPLSAAPANLSSTNAANSTQPKPLFVELYFFYDETCPYCQAALKQFTLWKIQYPNLRLRSFKLNDSETNSLFFYSMSQAYNFKDMSVPAFFIDNIVLTGYNDNVKNSLEQTIKHCSAISCVNPNSLVKQDSLNLQNQSADGESLFPKIMIYGGIVFGLLIFVLTFKKFFTG